MSPTQLIMLMRWLMKYTTLPLAFFVSICWKWSLLLFHCFLQYLPMHAYVKRKEIYLIKILLDVVNSRKGVCLHCWVGLFRKQKEQP